MLKNGCQTVITTLSLMSLVLALSSVVSVPLSDFGSSFSYSTFFALLVLIEVLVAIDGLSRSSPIEVLGSLVLLVGSSRDGTRNWT